MTAPARARKTTAAPPKPDTEVEYVTETTLGEVMDSLTGYDELAIEQELGRSIEVLAGYHEDTPGNDILLTRALIACHRRHEGDTHVKAWKYAMSMRAKELQTYFTPAGRNDDDMTTPELISESGKDVA